MQALYTPYRLFSRVQEIFKGHQLGVNMPEKRRAEVVYDPEDGSVADFVSQRLESKRRRKDDSDEEDNSSLLDDLSDLSELELELDSESDLLAQDVAGLNRERRNSLSSPAKAGIIKSILLRNFMCHEAFDLTLGPQLNFIIGRNGSGKSAVLTGISVGLGAKAMDTSRGSAIRSLIKDGKQTARVQIVLSNEGVEAYKPEDYGTKITVERKFQRNGTNNYYLRSENGKIISTKKSDLDEMLYRFNITVDNPLAFLLQDKAREFLTATTDKMKYDYFMAGALINDILENYRAISQNIVDVQQRQKLIKSDLVVSIKKYQESTIVYNQFKKSDYLRRKLELINGKMYWFNVSVIETKMAKYVADLAQKKSELEKVRKEVDDLNTKISGFEEEKDEANKQISNTQSDLIEALENSTKVKNKMKEIKSSIEIINDEMKNFNDEINQQKIELKKLGKELEKEQSKFDESSNLTVEKQIENLRNEKVKLELAKENITKKMDLLDGDSPEIINLKRKILQIQDILSSSKDKKRQLIDIQKDKYLPWGPGINRVKDEIDRSSSWHRPPIGPIGLYVGIKQSFSSWGDILNTSLNKNLDSFLVHDDHDRRILDAILKKHRINKNIITRKFEKFDFSQGKIKGHKTMLDALDISNENVLYTLVDTNYIEQNVLANNRNEARRILQESGRVRNVFSLLDHNSGHRLQQDGGTFRIDPIFYKTREPHKLARASLEDDLRTIETQIQDETLNLNSSQRELRRLRMIVQNEQQELESERSSLDLQLRKLEDQIFSMENRMNESSDITIVEALQERIKDATQMISQRNGFISGLEEDRLREAAKFKAAKSDFVQAKEVEDNIRHKLRIKERTLQEIETSFEVRTTERLRIEQSIESLKESISHLESKSSRAKVALQEHTKSAEERCRREEVNLSLSDTVELITAEYERTQEAVKESEKHIGRTYEEIQSELIQNKEVKDDLESKLSDLESISTELDDDLNQRLKYLQTTILKLIREALSLFEQLLALRGFKGELRFGFAEKTLTMLVQTKGDAKKRTVELLLGGEKLFTQIALLLAIWRSMNSKIRGLDEFDVFMDLVNRLISIRLLLSELRKYPKLQLIFITPQDIAVVGDLDADDIMIYKMDDPRNR